MPMRGVRRKGYSKRDAQEKRALEAERRLARERGKSDPHQGHHSWSFLIGSE
jgi:hypothetical protein